MRLITSTRTSPAPTGTRQRRWATTSTWPMTMVVVVVVLLVWVPPHVQRVEGAKSLKSLAKTFVFQQLTMRKNFLPLPVPIPGKWQTILNTIVDSGLLKGRHQHHHASSSSKAVVTASAAATPSTTNGGGGGGGSYSSALQMASTLVSKLPTAIKLSTKNGNKFSSQSSDSTGKKLLLFGASNLVDELSNNGKRLNKIFSGTSSYLSPSSASASASISPSSSSSSSSIDMNNVKKLTRLAAAKYATYIISTQPKGKNKQTTSTSGKSSSLVQKATDPMSASSGLAASEKGNKRNDVLVTAFNVVKLAQQIRELNPTKVLSLNLSKKSGLYGSPSSSSSLTTTGITGTSPTSSASAAASSMMASVATNAANNLVSASGIAGVPSLLSMNIDNKKTLLNKMHYFHKLTHRHHNNQQQHHLNLIQ